MIEKLIASMLYKLLANKLKNKRRFHAKEEIIVIRSILGDYYNF